MAAVAKPSSRRSSTADIYERILEVASGHLGAEGSFLGSRDWVITLFQADFPGDCLATVDRRLLSNFVQRAAYLGVKRGLIAPRRAPTVN